jgi:hypothetical protein
MGRRGPQRLRDRRVEPSRRLRAFLLALFVAGFMAGGGARVSLALMTDNSTASATFTTAASFDVVAPTVSSSVVSKTTPYWPGFIAQGGTYHIYANVSDGGAVPSGVATVTANTSSFDTGMTAVVLVAGSYSIGGVTYNYRSAQAGANGTLAAGLYAYTLTAADGAGNSATASGFSVTIDNTRPTATNVQTTNAGVAGQPGIGDTMTLTFSEPIDPESVLTGWNGSSTSVVVRIAQNTGGDRLTVRNAASSAQLPLGTVNLVGPNYVTVNRDFGVTGTPSTMVAIGNTIVLTLGTASGAVGTESATANMMWTPVTGAHDRADNTCQTTNATESGTLDLDF